MTQAITSNGAAAASDPVREARGRLKRLGMLSSPVGDEGVDGTRGRTLEAAIRMFVTRGFDGYTMRDLAAEVGVSAPALYNHFDCKEDILRDAVEFMLARFFTGVHGPIPDDHPNHRFEPVVRRYVRFQVEQADLASANDTLLRTGAPRRFLGPIHWEKLKAAMRAHIDLLRALIRAEGQSLIDDRLAAHFVIVVCDRVSALYHSERPTTTGDIADQTWLLVARMTGACQ